SSSGIGAHAAVQFAKEKANLILHGRNEERLKQVIDQCLSENSHTKVVYVVGNICDEGIQHKLIDTALKNLHSIHVLPSWGFRSLLKYAAPCLHTD
uniref:Uncharacterized protein n=1 Tax=Romanomermis culicivorax TaxID=13658 RepID=A0A915L9S9_ROMCU